VHLTLIKKVKREVYVTPKIKNYATSVVCKNSLTKSNSISNSTLVISKCNDVIPNKFKAIKFILSKSK